MSVVCPEPRKPQIKTRDGGEQHGAHKAQQLGLTLESEFPILHAATINSVDHTTMGYV